MKAEKIFRGDIVKDKGSLSKRLRTVSAAVAIIVYVLGRSLAAARIQAYSRPPVAASGAPLTAVPQLAKGHTKIALT